ncbi:hypothetical protein [Streptomyces sp. NPDC060001]|uniref:hypothetical protein n=1 Tax=Streptomyces sp. NPDC060001 TaxID=3347032 RepID=UPI0036A16055
MKLSRTIHTADGSSVSITPRGIEYDLHVRNAAGQTVATVEMNADDLDALINEAEKVQGW